VDYPSKDDGFCLHHNKAPWFLLNAKAKALLILKESNDKTDN